MTLAFLPLLFLAQEPQNPSPMVEHTRAHPRVAQQTPPGRREGNLFLPAKLKLRAETPLLIFFHGGDWLPQAAVARRSRMAVMTFPSSMKDPVKLTDAIAAAEAATHVKFAPLALGGWSAGCGTIRDLLLKSQELLNRTHALLFISRSRLTGRSRRTTFGRPSAERVT